LKIVSAPGFYETLTSITQELMQGLEKIAADAGESEFCTDSVGGMFGIYFSKNIPASFEDVNQSNKDKFNRFFHAMLSRGVYLAPSAFEAGFLSIQHQGAPIAETLAAAKASFQEIAAQ
jgi:glutamate-1-semialdehyde 2,1-aminomutase